jgi:DNA-binding CsgD family transcriptional regulator
MTYRERMNKAEQMIRTRQHSQAEIARECGISPTTVGDLCRAMGESALPKRVGKAKKDQIRALVLQGLTDPQVAAAVGVHSMSVYRTRKAEGLPSWHERGRQLIRAHVAANPDHTISQIARDLGHDRMTVKKALREGQA